MSKHPHSVSPHALVKQRLAECHAIIARLEKMMRQIRNYEVKRTRVPRMKIKAHYRAAHWRFMLTKR
jgi:hypothetical protein